MLLEVGLDDSPCIILADLLRTMSMADICSSNLKKLLFLIRGRLHKRGPWGLMRLGVDVLHKKLVSLTSNVLTQ